MIATFRISSVDNQTLLVHEKFLALLPQIREQAEFAFRGLRAEARDEFIQEVLANTYCAFAHLVRRGKADLAYPTPLVQFAIRQVRVGRRVGNRLNVYDVLSEYSQQEKHSKSSGWTMSTRPWANGEERWPKTIALRYMSRWPFASISSSG